MAISWPSDKESNGPHGVVIDQLHRSWDWEGRPKSTNALSSMYVTVPDKAGKGSHACREKADWLSMASVLLIVAHTLHSLFHRPLHPMALLVMSPILLTLHHNPTPWKHSPSL